MVFTNVINPRSHVARKDEYKTTLVRKGASLGANCTVVCGTTIGRYAFVGAGSVVTATFRITVWLWQSRASSRMDVRLRNRA